MELIEHFQTIISKNTGMVQVQLAKEDLARIEKLCELAKSSDNIEQMTKDGLYIGWTKGDFRTHELTEPLKSLIKSIYAYENGGDQIKLDAQIMDIWAAFHTQRLKVLVHCL